VLIRCEKCSTLYELDEKLLPPQGAPVQCSKCQYVFKAYPAGGEQPAPAQPAPPEPARRQEASPDLVREGGSLAGATPARAPARPAPGNAGSAPLPAMDGEQQFTADGRPIRKVPFPSAADAPVPGGPRPVLITSSSSSRRGASPGMLRLVLVVFVVALVAVAALVGWRLVAHRGERARPAGQGSVEAAQRPEQTALGTGAPQPRK
jgi:predicted Zn finger-like uncharacterized protein